MPSLLKISYHNLIMSSQSIGLLKIMLVGIRLHALLNKHYFISISII